MAANTAQPYLSPMPPLKSLVQPSHPELSPMGHQEPYKRDVEAQRLSKFDT